MFQPDSPGVITLILKAAPKTFRRWSQRQPHDLHRPGLLADRHTRKCLHSERWPPTFWVSQNNSILHDHSQMTQHFGIYCYFLTALHLGEMNYLSLIFDIWSRTSLHLTSFKFKGLPPNFSVIGHKFVVTILITIVFTSLIFPISLHHFRLKRRVILVCHHMALPYSPPFIIVFVLLWTFSCSILSSLLHHQQNIIPLTYTVALKLVLQLKTNLSLSGLLVPNIQKFSFQWKTVVIKELWMQVCFVLRNVCVCGLHFILSTTSGSN